ncbi:hypothetical protein GGH94_005504 [Coemansia aciculifera]|uniref:Uncharacterized protein n=1 Tax=Coemansia aciculifera TaxID=417176 RepID=A0A9W8M491_9FUNG|nr:hypothetical protein GGH94_005504 [Coemansia aciculifera]
MSSSEVVSIPVEEPIEVVEEQYEEQAPGISLKPVCTFIGPVILSLVFFSMVGVLVRVHVNRMFSYPGVPVFGLIWVQMLGCFIMGMAMRLKGVLLSYSPALNTGITTGLCGSITTFSSWQLLLFQELFNTFRSDHSQFRNFLGGMSVLTTELGCSVAAIRLGQMIGDEVCIAYNYLSTRNAPAGTQISKVETAMFSAETSGHRDGWFAWDKWAKFDVILAAGGIAGVIASTIVVALAPRTRSFKTLALIAAVGQATATLDILTNSQISERLFGLSTEQVKNIDRAVHDASVPIVQAASQIVRTMRPAIDEFMQATHKVADETVNAVRQAMTPDTRAKIRTSVMNAVKTTMDTYV